ncbi:MAG: DegT/DnrJ/EryC1/StrS family aminotransferase [Acidobacteria bacterium]|nr:DegT/DnrJ/EryC1/StrS family aminotransferase [Acidobacteriota bacterium]
MIDWRVPLSDVSFGEAEERAALRVLRGGWLSTGPETRAFEEEFAAFVGARHAVAVANGTAALHLALLAVGAGFGGEVVQPATNFVAAANMTVAVGASPVFADILALDEPTIDPAEIERRLSPRTRAVVVMHYGGHVARMREVRAICAARRVAVVEDACHAVGARYVDGGAPELSGRAAGALGDAACFSFFANKNLTTGEGGMVTTDRDDVAERVRLLRSHGMTTLSWQRHQGHASSYEVLAHGFNYRFDEVRAAVGRVQLAKLEENNRRRARLARLYRDLLRDARGWIVPFAERGEESAHHLMVAVAPDAGARREAVASLRAARIQTSLHYPCVADFAAFCERGGAGARTHDSPRRGAAESLTGGDLSRSREFARRAITLPLFPAMTEAQVEEVCDALSGAKVKA